MTDMLQDSNRSTNELVIGYSVVPIAVGNSQYDSGLALASIIWFENEQHNTLDRDLLKHSTTSYRDEVKEFPTVLYRFEYNL